MIRKISYLLFMLVTSVAMAMNNEEIQQINTTTPTTQPTLMVLNPAECSKIECEELAPPSQPLNEFLIGILEAAIPGTYIDTSEQLWNVSDYDAFAQFVGNKNSYIVSSDSVRPEGVYTYPDMGLISVIYDFFKDKEQFFSLELTRTSDEYRIAREHENIKYREYRAMCEMQNKEYQESLDRDREAAEQKAREDEAAAELLQRKLIANEDDDSRRIVCKKV